MHAIEFHGDERLELVERPDPVPGGGRAADRARARSASAAPTSRSSTGRWPTSGWGSPPTRSCPGHEWTGTVVDVGRGRHRLLARRPGRGGGRDRLRRLRALPRRPRRTCARGGPRPASCTWTARWPRGCVFPAAYAHRVDFERAPRVGRADARSRCTRVRRGRVRGSAVLVVGAGPIGLLVAQCARAEGADVGGRSPTRARIGWSSPRRSASPRYVAGDGGRDRRRRAVRRRPRRDPLRVRRRPARRDGRRARALGAPTIPFDFDGLVVRDIDLIGVLGSVGYWEPRDRADRERAGRDRAARHAPRFRSSRALRRARQLWRPRVAEGRDRAVAPGRYRSPSGITPARIASTCASVNGGVEQIRLRRGRPGTGGRCSASAASRADQSRAPQSSSAGATGSKRRDQRHELDVGELAQRLRVRVVEVRARARGSGRAARAPSASG